MAEWIKQKKEDRKIWYLVRGEQRKKQEKR